MVWHCLSLGSRWHQSGELHSAAGKGISNTHWLGGDRPPKLWRIKAFYTYQESKPWFRSHTTCSLASVLTELSSCNLWLSRGSLPSVTWSRPSRWLQHGVPTNIRFPTTELAAQVSSTQSWRSKQPSVASNLSTFNPYNGGLKPSKIFNLRPIWAANHSYWKNQNN
jgi:hypothetical protein